MNQVKLSLKLEKFYDVRYIIFLVFLLRLYGITQPPIEVAHNWRQTTVTMVARNFFEVDANILYPRIDIAGEKTGITGMEFPLLNYLIYLVSLIFGYAHWYGRLINLMVSSIGVWYFFKILRSYFDERLARLSAVFLLFSIWFAYSRKIMPDTFSMSLVIIGFYYGLRFFREHRLKHLFWYVLFAALGVLSKLPSGYILVLFAWYIFSPAIPWSRKWQFSAASIMVITIGGIWYFFWVPELISEFGFKHFFTGKGMLIGIREIGASLDMALKHFYERTLLYTGFLCFLAGLFFSIKNRRRDLLLIFGTSFMAFLVVVFKSGYTFSHHSYYMVPFAPVMSLMAGYGLYELKRKIIVTVLISALVLECLATFHYDFRNERNLELLQIEAIMDKYTGRDDLILINCGSYPTPMYFAHRKGWIAGNDRIGTQSYVRSLEEKGLACILILRSNFGSDINLPYREIYEDKYFRLYDLEAE